MGDDLAGANVNRVYGLAATCIAIFTFTLIFLYPRYETGEVDSILFQTTLIVLGLATFSFVFATFLYYGAAMGRWEDTEQGRYTRRADRLWLIGYSLLFLDPSLVLAAVGLQLVGAVWFGLWLAYVLVAIRFFPRIQSG